MPENKKINIVYLFPGPIYRPDLPDFKHRFEMLSEYFEGEVYSWSCDPKFQEYEIGSFIYRGLVGKSDGLAGKWQLARHMIGCVRQYHKRKKVDAVICYDPLFTGILGVVLKFCIKTKVVVEINNFSFNESFSHHYGNGPRIKIKIYLASLVQHAVCFFCDRIKILTERQKISAALLKWENKISVFHDFVPTHYFEEADIDKKEILFVGYPFYLKGVDMLIRAFNKIHDQHPEFMLRMIGHRLEEDAGVFFDQQRGPTERMVFHKGMFYEELKEYFLNCYCFVLPSRTEGLPRVLIEAMACGKALIGTRVGGVPDLIDDGVNGYLVDPEDVNGLADKLEKLMSDPDLARRMGEESWKIVDGKFSSKRYVESFNCMMKKVLFIGNRSNDRLKIFCRKIFSPHLLNVLIYIRNRSFLYALKVEIELRGLQKRYQKSRIKKNRKKTILFYPDFPTNNFLAYEMCKVLGLKMVNNPGKKYDLCFYWDYKTARGFDGALDLIRKDCLVINKDFNDSGKDLVSRVFEEVFGYALEIDPRVYHGVCVKKSKLNATHDGEIIECPVNDIDESCVYQKLINNIYDDKYTLDFRVSVTGGRIPFVYKIFRKIEDRFDHVQHETFDDVEKVFAKDEIVKIVKFCQKLQIDIGDLDILRDNDSGLIYIVDANNTSWGSCYLNKEDRAETIILRAGLFEESFLND